MPFKIDFYPEFPHPSKKDFQEKFENFQKTISDPAYGFFSVTDNERLATDCLEIYKKLKKPKNFIHIGIGGSSLGAKMLIQALARDVTNFKFIDNIDPETISEQLDHLDYRDTLFYIVSKSGKTIETMAAFIIITNWLEKQGVKPENFKDYLVCATDSRSGDLRNISRQLQLHCLDIPANVGGRFSILTAVGLFPSLFADIDIKELLDGANNIKKDILKQENNLLFKTAFFIMELAKQGINQTVFMPYSSKLKELSFWMT
ncbi:MAG: hypothetical protein OXB84_02725, partial [Halobacteriovoraceae bacterium]|nr:hypothetical protein [Halobacteriovoraceae bacterium]